ncbi:hypothetical protein SB768_17745 [Burkholderia sp. SIMBA_043]|jgi:hypothetical protein|uniref:Uncharacterized protein n=1 Tax=Burkholderia ubonensis TaxID=101571 RepID=A0A1B4LHD2_9BURK|nr:MULTISPECIES: hypothetical protein [Burkholderia cepacia complex]AJY08124.1 hypothetical protein AK36_5488 [Burkholderia vietnamiensis LMG 10929]AOJ17139.1 hypothetical protein WJ02_26075 [Burkholderia vietnamiensis]AOJ76589.1 hypothetical protein WJ35_15905 [Burkholderia ubonensis]AOK13678.1 hypothetical protein WK31_25360 [Burkholderia vietnamiensis]AVR14756.1 hypothetical protein A8H33_15085 [Burkholderia vietnamiensis]
MSACASRRPASGYTRADAASALDHLLRTVFRHERHAAGPSRDAHHTAFRRDEGAPLEPLPLADAHVVGKRMQRERSQ